jgi:acyl-CoA thioester hydrolase
MTIDAPLRSHREVVRPEWIDYNGHMNVAYYVLAFDYATEKFLDFVGLDEGYRRKSGYSTFSVEAHVTYQREVRADDVLEFETRLLGYDEKRIHFMHHMFHAEEGFLAATSEWLNLHVDMRNRRVAPMPASLTARLAAVLEAHRYLRWPAEAGRTIRIPNAKRG